MLNQNQNFLLATVFAVSILLPVKKSKAVENISKNKNRQSQQA